MKNHEDSWRFTEYFPVLEKVVNKGKLRLNSEKRAKKMVHPARFELTTFYSGGRRSIQLSYGCITLLTIASFYRFATAFPGNLAKIRKVLLSMQKL